MKTNIFKRYYLFSVLGVLIASFYPLYMGTSVIWDMLANGSVAKENYPKYIIPYTPICIGILAAVILLPLFIKLFKKLAVIGGSLVGIATFLLFEILFEKNVVVSSEETVAYLEDWQMYMCYVPPEGWTKTLHKTETPVEILMGEYNPAFKLHFYIISAVLILVILNCIYGFAEVLRSQNKKRVKPLILQSVTATLFLGLCILACFTAFWRTGELAVSPISAFLMAIFFILLGVTVGIYVGSFLTDKKGLFSVAIPAAISSLLTLIMYIGEMILLSGNLYILGSGFLFGKIPYIVLAPIDILIVIMSGVVTAVILKLLNRKAE